jgi:hypothetical protein
MILSPSQVQLPCHMIVDSHNLVVLFVVFVFELKKNDTKIRYQKSSRFLIADSPMMIRAFDYLPDKESTPGAGQCIADPIHQSDLQQRHPGCCHED